MLLKSQTRFDDHKLEQKTHFSHSRKKQVTRERQASQEVKVVRTGVVVKRYIPPFRHSLRVTVADLRLEPSGQSLT